MAKTRGGITKGNVQNRRKPMRSIGRTFVLKVPPRNTHIAPPSIEYIAGFFDGIGSVYIPKRGELRARMANTYRLGLEIIAQHFPGLCTLNEEATQTQGYRVKYYLDFSGKNAREFFELILPYLYFKSASAGMGIAYQNWKDERPFMASTLTSEQRRKIKEASRPTYELLKAIHRQERLNPPSRGNETKPVAKDDD